MSLISFYHWGCLVSQLGVIFGVVVGILTTITFCRLARLLVCRCGLEVLTNTISRPTERSLHNINNEEERMRGRKQFILDSIIQKVTCISATTASIT